MFRSLKRALLAVTVVGSMLSSVLTAAPAFAAGTATLTFNPTSNQVAVGATFDVPVHVNISGGGSLGDQFGVVYDPNVLTLNSAADGNFFSGYASTVSGCSSINANPWTPPTSPGNTQVGADSLLGAACGAGASGTGTLATFNFTGKPGINAITTLSFTPVNAQGTQINGITTVTPTSLNVTVGTPPAPHLAVTGAVTTAVSGDPTHFNVSYAVQNTGNAPSDNAGHSLSVVVTTGATTLSTDSFTLPLAAGASTSTKTDGPFLLSGSLENITITADAGGTAGGPATGATAYQYAAIHSSGNTNIAANLAASLVLTAPASITNWVLSVGQTNNFPDGNLTVKSNVDYSVTVADQNASNNGHLTEFNPGTGTFVTGGAQLLQALGIQTSSPAALITISGTPQTYVSGLASGQDPNFGASFPTTFYQFVGFNDKPVKAPNTYYETLVFAASGTF